MTTLPSLLTLLGQAEATRDVSQADCQRAEADAQAARRQVEQLLGYRSDYEQRWRAQFARQASMEIVRCYQGFMQRLSQAVDQQRRIAEHCEDRLRAARDSLREHELRLQSIKKLIERRSKELEQALARQEQRHADELATQSALNRPVNPLQAAR